MVLVFAPLAAVWLWPHTPALWISIVAAASATIWSSRFGGIPRDIDVVIGSIGAALGEAGRASQSCLKLAAACLLPRPSMRATLMRRRGSTVAQSSAHLVPLIALSPEHLVLRGDDVDGLLIHVFDETSLNDADLQRLELQAARGGREA